MNNNKNKTVYFVSGGGTGGHIYPAIAVINELKDRGYKNIYYIGNPKNPEFIIAKDNNIKFLPVIINAMPRKMSFSALFWVIKLFISILVSMFYILKYRPNLIFTTGGYVSAPILFAAKFLKIPYAQHDADAQPGIVTRYFSSNAVVLTSPFECVKETLKTTNVEITGNPIRKEFICSDKPKAKIKLGIESQKTILLVMGGSQGARSINNAIIPILQKLLDEFDICIFHQSGKKRFKETISLLEKEFPNYKENENYRLMPYIDDMPSLLCASDIAISRSGSLSLSELCATGVASILVPYPYSAANHQMKNAQAMVDRNCSILIEDNALTPELLYKTIANLLNNKDKLNILQSAAIKNSMPNATNDIVERLIKFNG